MARIDYDRISAAYADGRTMPLDALDAWRVALAPYLRSLAAPVADIGAGTGMFAAAFAQWFGVRVVAVEPAEGMRREALRRNRHRLVRHVAGDATSLPLRRASCGAAWLSTVIHHFADLAAAAREVRRALPARGPVLIRSAFPGRQHLVTLFRYFPAAARVVDTFPSIETTRAAFETAGFAFESVTPVPQRSADSLRAFHDRARLRADTTLLGIGDEEFAEGLRELDAAAAREVEARPVIDELDLMVLRAI